MVTRWTFFEELFGVICCSRHRPPEGGDDQLRAFPPVSPQAGALKSTDKALHDPDRLMETSVTDHPSGSSSEETPSTSSDTCTHAPSEKRLTALHVFLDEQHRDAPVVDRQGRARMESLDNFLSDI
mmetsp:Transcript_41852/g.77760  ORF Transcript_41852/g.77760 Transcript_41852/m.77760 type:complete len:126 (-) Transcript_41852:68-445(-)